MNVIAEVEVIPLGGGSSMRDPVKSCTEVFKDAGLEHEVHATGTDVRGEWNDVMAAVRRCHEVVHGHGVPRVSTTLKLETRVDKEQSLAERTDAVK